MDKGYYNTYTLSDSDNDSVAADGPRTNIDSLKNDILSSPEEPDFFRQVVLQHKRKKLSSPDISVQQCHEKDIRANENQNRCTQINDSEPNTYVPEKQKSETDIHPTPNYDQIPEMTGVKRKKRLTKAEMEEKKKEEKAQKDAKKKLSEELKRFNPKECMKYMTVHIDINLQDHDYSDQILSEIQSTDAKYKIELSSNIPHSITWSRQMSDTVSKDENFMLLIWDIEYVKSLIINEELTDKMNLLKLYKPQIALIIYSTADQLKSIKNTRPKKGCFSWLTMVDGLENLLINCHVSFRFINNKKDVGLSILYFTKSLAQMPFKLKKYKEEQSGCDWYASGLAKNCVTINKDGVGVTQLWRQMLSQFPLCSLETSEAIASKYRSPKILLDAYDKCSSRLEGETLLQDIPVRRGFGPLASNRRIGPELSKKIYTFFTDNTGCTTLSQE